MFQLPSDFRWLAPWSPIDAETARDIEDELRREIPDGHVLAGCQFKAIGESDNYDDFLFATDSDDIPLASVHLTWRVESDPTWPGTAVYRSLVAWINAMANEHADFEQWNQGEDETSFDEFIASHPKGTVLPGRVTSVQPFGVFCELAAGVEGLLEVVEFEIGERTMEFPDSYPRVGDILEVAILHVNRSDRKIALTQRNICDTA